MFDGLVVYYRHLTISLRAQMQYRASALMGGFGLLFLTTLEFLGIAALFARFRTFRGWSLAEIAVLYGMANISLASAQVVTRGFERVSQLVLNGDFDRILLRPRTTAMQIAGLELRLLALGRFVQGLAILSYGISIFHIDWSVPKALLLVAATLGGALTFAGVFILEGTLAFFTTESLELMNTLSYGGLDAAQFPLSIYERWLRWLFTFVVPLAFMNYFPVIVLSGRAPPGSLTTMAGWCAPLAGPAFLALSLQAWRLGVRHYRSVGA